MQSSLSNYFQSRKRPNTADSVAKRKVVLLESGTASGPKPHFNDVKSTVEQVSTKKDENAPSEGTRTARKAKKQVSIAQAFAKSKSKEIANVSFEKKGPLSPRKNPQTSVTAGATLEHLKKIPAEDLKNKLEKCTKLADLKSRLAKMNGHMQKLKDFAESAKQHVPKPQLQKFEKIDVQVPPSPKKMQSPVKSPQKVPAYQRYASLASATALPLPFKFRFLLEIFHCVETVTSMLHKRKEAITFTKLKPAVQQLLGRNFNEEYLAQIKAVYPEAYKFSREKVRHFGLSPKKSNVEDLVLAYVLTNEDGRSKKELTPTTLLGRKKILQERLLEIAVEHHNEFLKNLDPPFDLCGKQLTRWHPDFDLDSIPDITPSPLPQPPVIKCMTAKEVLESRKDLFACNSRLAKVISDTQSEDEKAATSSAPAPIPNALKGVPLGLLEKIRAKQSAKLLREMTRPAEKDKELTMMKRLPDMSRIIRNTFICEKKAALPMETVLQKLLNSCSSLLSPAEGEEHVRLLARVVPDWITFHQLERGIFVKIAKAVDVNDVIIKLENQIKNS